MPSSQDDSPELQAQQKTSVRCLCNKLIFIRYGDMIEIKCNKCKRMVHVYTDGIRKIEFK